MSAVAAALGRFGRPGRGAKPPLSELFYAFHFDASLYARFLRTLAERQGTIRREGRLTGVERDGARGDVAAVRLERGERIAGDLFLDCSVFLGLLIDPEPGAGFMDGSPWLPVARPKHE